MRVTNHFKEIFKEFFGFVNSWKSIPKKLRTAMGTCTSMKKNVVLLNNYLFLFQFVLSQIIEITLNWVLLIMHFSSNKKVNFWRGSKIDQTTTSIHIPRLRYFIDQSCEMSEEQGMFASHNHLQRASRNRNSSGWLIGSQRDTHFKKPAFEL